jgi:hypothetical protein
VIRHAFAYINNGRGWNILIDMLASGDMTGEELASIIGKTKSEFKAKNNVYKYLQPIVKLAKAEAAYETAVA